MNGEPNIYLHINNLEKKESHRNFYKTVKNAISFESLNPNTFTLIGDSSKDKTNNLSSINALNQLNKLFPGKLARFYGSSKSVGERKPLPKMGDIVLFKNKDCIYAVGIVANYFIDENFSKYL